MADVFAGIEPRFHCLRRAGGSFLERDDRGIGGFHLTYAPLRAAV
jgi:hypothetical protein